MSTENRYTIGDLVHVTATFTDPATNNPVTPTTVTAEVKDPIGHVTTPTLTPGSTGTYTFDIPATQAGEWRYRIASTGNNQAAAESSFIVTPSYF